MRQAFLALLAGLCLAGRPVLAGAAEGGAQPIPVAQATAGDLLISNAWVRAMLPGQKNGAAYLAIANRGAAADRLLSVSSPQVRRLEVHSMRVENDVMTMRPVEGGVEIPAGATVQLAPGALHLMLMDPAAPLKSGGTVELDMRFERAGTVRLMLPVRKAGGQGQAM